MVRPVTGRHTTVPLVSWIVLVAVAAAADVPEPRLVPPPSCSRAQELPPGRLEELRRFLPVPEGYAQWRERDCFPPRLDRETLARTIRPYDVIVSVAGAEAVTIDPGSDWLGECARAGLRVSAPHPVTGPDLIAVLDEIAARPDLAATDIREIGLGMATQAENGSPLYSLTLGTPRAVARVQCFEDVGILVERAATALQQARQATVW